MTGEINTIPAQTFEIGLSEPMDPASAANATATLTPDAGNAQALTVTLAADSRTAYLTGATITTGTSYTLHVEGLTDTSGNPLWPEDQQLTVADPNACEVLSDQTAPQLLAVLDASDGIYLRFDEPVQSAAGFDLTTAVSITRQGQLVDGTTTRITSQLLEWQPSGTVGGLIVGGTYTLSALNLQDLASNGITTTPATFTHLTTSDQMLLLAYQAPTDTQPEAASAYGLTTLFHGRTWHGDLGMYSYRNRWYLPEMGDFAERDPVDPSESVNLYAFLDVNSANLLDPSGKQFSPYGGFNSEPDNREVRRRYEAGQGTDYGRFTAGLVAEAWGVITDTNGGFSPLVGGNGLHIGVNLQFWERSNGDVLAGVFAFDSHSAVLERELAKKDWGPFGPWGIMGEGASLAFAVNTARYRGPERNGFLDLEDEVVIDRWKGEFKSIGFSAPGLSLAGFWSPYYAGVEVSAGVFGQGIGVEGSITYYNPVATRRLSSVVEMTDFITENLEKIARSGGRLGRKVRDRLLLKYEHYKQSFFEVLFPASREVP